MALTITAQGEAILPIAGTETELSSVYARIEFACPKNGESMQGALSCYVDKAKYTADPSSMLSLEGFQSLYNVDIDIATESQSLQTGHEKIKADLEALGYSVTIIDL